MKRQHHVDAAPCFLPLFMLFGGLAGNRAAKRRAGMGAQPYSYPRTAPYMGGGYPPMNAAPGYGQPYYYSPWAMNGMPYRGRMPMNPGNYGWPGAY